MYPWYHHHREGYKHIIHHLPKFPPVPFIIIYVCVCMLRTLNIRSSLFASFKYMIQCSVMFFISRSSLWFLFRSPYSLIFFSFLFIFTDSLDITEQENVKYPGAYTLGHLAPYLLGEAHRNRIPYRCAHPHLLDHCIMRYAQGSRMDGCKAPGGRVWI